MACNSHTFKLGSTSNTNYIYSFRIFEWCLNVNIADIMPKKITKTKTERLLIVDKNWSYNNNLEISTRSFQFDSHSLLLSSTTFVHFDKASIIFFSFQRECLVLWMFIWIQKSKCKLYRGSALLHVTRKMVNRIVLAPVTITTFDPKKLTPSFY